MIRRLRQCVTVVLFAAVTVACTTPREIENNTVSVPPNAGIYKVGNPYQTDGIWYYPREQPDYDETGVASWYGAQFHGKRTSNGEIFDSNALTAAHRTLPMPVNVRVTNLENGRSLVLRINDRGPFARGRIIDVSKHAAELLGFYAAGTARVRVTFLSRADMDNGEPPPDNTPAEIATAVPAVPTGQVDTSALNPVPGAAVAPPVQVASLAPVAASSAPSSAADIEPTGQVTHVPVPAVTHLYVQAGAFGSLANANRLKTRLAAAGGLFVSPIDRNGQRLYRVRIGPFDDVNAADAALAKLVGLGSNDSQIVVDQ
ncbi:MAG: septal ring lytic transglycosylase RlpA family protein [Rhizomicrobium sp.]